MITSRRILKAGGIAVIAALIAGGSWLLLRNRPDRDSASAGLKVPSSIAEERSAPSTGLVETAATRRVVPMSAAGPVIFVVRDAHASVPIKGAQVFEVADPQGKSAQDLVGVTDESGRAAVQTVHRYCLVVATGYAKSLIIRPDNSRPPAEVEVGLYPAGVIRGRVVDVDGSPISGISLRANQWHTAFSPDKLSEQPLSDAGIAASTFTSVEGLFKLDGLRVGQEYVIESNALGYYLSRPPRYVAQPEATADEAVISLLPVYAWALVLDHLPRNWPLGFKINVTPPPELIRVDELFRTIPEIAPVSPQQDGWIRAVLAASASAAYPKGSMVTYGCAVLPRGQFAHTFAGPPAIVSMQTQCPGLGDTHTPPITWCRVSSWGAGALTVVDLEAALSAGAYYSVSVRFKKPNGEPAGFVPACRLIETDDTFAKPKEMGCRWIITTEAGESEAVIRVPAGDYVLAPRYDAPWGTLPLSFDRFELRVKENAAVAIAMDKPIALIELRVVDRYGFGVDSFNIRSPTLNGPLQLSAKPLFAVPRSVWSCQINPIGYSKSEEAERAFQLALGQVNHIEIVLSSFR